MAPPPPPVPSAGPLRANAWTGSEAASGHLSADAAQWAREDHVLGAPSATLAADPLAGLDPLDARVGWGLVLPERPGLTRAELARADDAPEPARLLAAARSATGVPVVLRYRPGDLTHLHRYLPSGVDVPVPTAGDGSRGASVGALPWYLLLLGPPEELPWELQLVLNTSSHTGRLDLDAAGLEHYVEAALGGWATAAVDATSPLAWTVEHGPADITRLLREEVGAPVVARWRGDPQIGDRAVELGGPGATGDALADALAEQRPAVVVTTSHGATDTSVPPEEMRRTLGTLVDATHTPVPPERLLRDWQPDGVVWYSLACCSAGGSGRNLFEGLLDPGSSAGAVVAAVAGLGPTSAALPRALLGAPRPARAVVGHLEPTFDWTLRRPDTHVSTSAALVSTLYDKLFQARPLPVGPAFRAYLDQAGALRSAWALAGATAGSDPAAAGRALVAALTSIDRQCTVILGDPAVAPAALPPQ